MFVNMYQAFWNLVTSCIRGDSVLESWFQSRHRCGPRPACRVPNHISYYWISRAHCQRGVRQLGNLARHSAPTVPQLCPDRFCLNCAPTVPQVTLCPNCASTVPQLCLARLPNCRGVTYKFHSAPRLPYRLLSVIGVVIGWNPSLLLRF